MRLLVLYASDLLATSRVAPGGITNNLRGYLGQLPSDWDIDMWGVRERGTAPAPLVDVPLAHRSVRLWPIVTAGDARTRSLPLNVAYSAGLAVRRLTTGGALRRFDVILAHRTEYVAALTWGGTTPGLPPIVSMIHGSSAFTRAAMGRLKGGMHDAGERLSVRWSVAVALVSGTSVPYYRAKYPAYADRFLWIPNGVDATRFASPDREGWRRAHGFAPDDRLLVYHGRYDEEKGIRRVLKLFQQLVDMGERWHLVTAGVGPLAAEIASAAGGWGTGRIHDLGYVGPSAIAAMLPSCDVGLLLSDFEGLSNGLLECLAAGIPVVATDVGDNRLVLEGVSPQLVVASDASSETIASTVQRAWEERVSLVSRTRDVAERFSLERRGVRIRDLLLAAADNPGDLSARQAEICALA